MSRYRNARSAGSSAGVARTPIRRLAAIPAQERLTALGSSWGGLAPSEASERLRLGGPNEPVRPEVRRPLKAFAAHFVHTLALLLWFGAGLAFAAGVPELGGAIVAVVAVNGVFAFVQEFRAEQVVNGLMRRVAVQARAIRGGTESRVPSHDLVVGDVIRLGAGDIVPADCALLDSDNLSLDLSLLSGEPVPVIREAAPMEFDPQANIGELTSIAPAGGAVVTGTALAVVCATGPESTLGVIAALVGGVERGDSVLERQITGLSRVTAMIAVLAGAATLMLVGATSETGFVTALTFATGVIVALVPEGLLPTLNVSLAIGARRMASRGAAVRRLSAVEIVGSATVICTDKTGTLTRNVLTVAGFEGPTGGPAGEEALLAAALCNDARLVDGQYDGDPLDAALARWLPSAGIGLVRLREEHPRLADVPFDAHRRYMSVTCEVDGRRRVFLKGAPEAVELLTGESPAGVRSATQRAAVNGERVLLVAAGEEGEPPVILGLVRFHDPPRPEVPAAIASCRQAGVRVVMLTGDHPATARAVANAVGFGSTIPLVEGHALAAMSDAELLEVLRRDAIFARIDPEQKLRIVQLLRRSGEVVVVTGDGINDAPALRAADVGVAMGLRGTEVAKQAADIILADDNFATIVAAIEEGRSIKTNIRRFVSYVFTSNVAELAPFLLYVFLPVPLPLAVIQVLAIDLGTDLLPALALGAERPSAGTMRSPPEAPRIPLLTRPLALRTFLYYGLIEAALGMAAFAAYYIEAGWRPFNSMDGFGTAFEHRATTLTFLGIVSGQVGCLFAARDGSLRARLSLRSNRWVAAGLAFEAGLALALVYVPGLNTLFSMAPVHPAWLLTLPAGAAVFLALDALRRWMLPGRPGPTRKESTGGTFLGAKQEPPNEA